MPLAAMIGRIRSRTVSLPRLAQHGAAVGLVAAAIGLRHVTGPLWPMGVSYMLLLGSVLCAASLFGRGAGYVAVVASGLSAAWTLPPSGSLFVANWQHGATLGVFLVIASAMVLVLETMHHAMARLRNALADLRRAEAGRVLLLHEFRHRSRNDLQSLVGLLLLRARGAPPEARVALREAADHALGLARVHTRLVAAARGDAGAVVDTAEFVLGLCDDLARGAAGDGLRPVALVAEAESHSLSTERAVHTGLVLNECVANALKYAFPSDQAGKVAVTFRRDGLEFELVVADDGCGLAAPRCPNALPSTGLGTRMLRALGAQLRGSFKRGPGEYGGTVCVLRFPVPEPGQIAS